MAGKLLTIRLVDSARAAPSPRRKGSMPSAAPITTAQARRRDAAATREALLAAGAELFAERGYDGVPVTAIAQRAGVNKAMINYHFGGKRKLYLAIVSVTFAEIVAGVEKLAESRRPAPEVLRELIAVVGEMATRRHPHFCAMMRSEEHTSELQSLAYLVCRLLLEKKKKQLIYTT